MSAFSWSEVAQRTSNDLRTHHNGHCCPHRFHGSRRGHGSADRPCVLIVIGVNARGEKHFLATKDGARASTQTRREVQSNVALLNRNHR